MPLDLGGRAVSPLATFSAQMAEPHRYRTNSDSLGWFAASP
jgi:hypothetical protein